MRHITFTTQTESYTGSILYSDSYRFYNRAQCRDREGNIYSGWRRSPGDQLIRPSSVRGRFSGLNAAAGIPIIGIFAGVCRVALAVIHIIGHLFAALIKWDRGHLCHVVKGGAELLRGLIEMLPIIGRIFAFKQDFHFAHVDDFEIASVIPSQGESIFLVKILNPNADQAAETRNLSSIASSGVSSPTTDVIEGYQLSDQVIETMITNIVTKSRGISPPAVDIVEGQEEFRRMLYAMSDSTVEAVSEVAKEALP